MATIETVTGATFSAWDINASGYAPGNIGSITGNLIGLSVGVNAQKNFLALYSSASDIDPNFDPANNGYLGTIDGAAIYDSTGVPLINFTDFSLSAASLFPLVATQAEFWEAFWETMLAGATTFNLAQGSTSYVMGDYAIVDFGQTKVGAVDTFNGLLNDAGGHVAGDALGVGFGATLTGGNDVFNFYAVANVGGATNLVLVGDVGAASLASNGTINGGNDSITVNATSTINAQLTGVVTIFGDVETLGASSTLQGGNDTILVTDVASGNTFGDFGTATSATVTGGNDTIVFQRVPGTAAYATSSFGEIDGDGNSQNGGSIIGGVDSITITNASGIGVNGDVGAIQDANFTGGADVIIIRNTLSLPALGNAPLAPPAVESISGDANIATGSGNFTGGSDAITLTNIFGGTIVGDIYLAVNSGTFVGGNDTITDNYSYAANGGSLLISGDAAEAANASFKGGNDTIVFNGNLGSGNTIGIIGDLSASTLLTPGTGVFTGGNDSLTANNTNAQVGVLLVGDLASANAALLSFTGGNDTLRGGAGNDFLYGDTQIAVTATVYVGGNDTLDGRGGNDLIDGGLGNDTASFASLAQSVYVDLQGIYNGSADPFEAMGQGFDQFVSIENVTGSIMNDTILGDSGVNIINGGAGNDTMTGRGGADSYYVDSLLDKVIEGVGGGSDRIYTYGSYTLAVGQEVEIISTANNAGTTAINITGNEFNNSIAGNAGINTINGGGGNDTIYGYAGADTLIGGVGNGLDNLFGGNGNDILTGGGGADSFSFNFALNATTNRDTITDFVVVDDTIKLDHLIFATLGVGALNPNAFWSSATGVAHDADDRIVYNTTTGVLTYDSNGNAAGGDIAFATLTGAPAALTSLDFVVI